MQSNEINVIERQMLRNNLSKEKDRFVKIGSEYYLVCNEPYRDKDDVWKVDGIGTKSGTKLNINAVDLLRIIEHNKYRR